MCPVTVHPVCNVPTKMLNTLGKFVLDCDLFRSPASPNALSRFFLQRPRSLMRNVYPFIAYIVLLPPISGLPLPPLLTRVC